MHALNGTIPHYENIIQTHKRAHELIDSQRVKIEGEKKKIVYFYSRRSSSTKGGRRKRKIFIKEYSQPRRKF